MEVNIEINEDVTVILSNWVYDAIINRTISQIRQEDEPELIIYLEQRKRSHEDILSFTDFDSDEYKAVVRYFRDAYFNSRDYYSGIFKRKPYKKFLKEYSDFIYMLSRDDRYYI